MSFEPVAIVGRACLLPGVDTPEALWDAVREGRDLITPTPPGRWRLDPDLALRGPDSVDADRAWSDMGGYVRGFDEGFDPEGFALPAARISELDPVFRWTLHVARQALRDAGDPRGRADAVFGNLSFPSGGLARWAESAWLAHVPPAIAAAAGVGNVDPRERFNSSGPPRLLQEALGLSGQVFALDAACASSLYAIKIACDRLHAGLTDVALAGAVNRADDLFIHVGFCALGALSRSGRSRPFHPDADGLVPAEGAAFLVLKRLADARADGDVIHGVIRGIGLSNDGRGQGLLAPSAEGQERALRAAWEVAGMSPDRLGLLECHATGTQLGDATELRSAASVFATSPDLPVGSLKANLGHLITAAGAAGIIKCLEAMKAGVRPPTPGLGRRHPGLEGTPLRPLSEAEPWIQDGPRVAAVSAFGFGGNNAHVILEEPPPDAPATARSPVVAVSPGARAADQTTASGGRVEPAVAEPLAVVGVGLLVGEAAGCAAVEDAVLAGRSLVVGGRARASEVHLDLATLRVPPADLAQTLPQQLMVVAAVAEAAPGPLPRERSAVYVGMESDPDVARYGARWRAAGWARALGRDRRWTADVRDALVAPLDSSGVVGSMPNIPANRVNRQLDIGGPGFTVSSGALSGLHALQLAGRALARGEIDAAVVAAVDLACQDAHVAACRALGDDRPPGDCAVALVVKRLADAEAAGDPVHAVLDAPTGSGPQIGAGPASAGLTDLTQYTGHAPAASGLLHVALATASVRSGRPLPGLDAADAMDVAVHASGSLALSVRAPASRPARPERRPPTRPWSVPAHRAEPRAALAALFGAAQTMAPAPPLPRVLPAPGARLRGSLPGGRPAPTPVTPSVGANPAAAATSAAAAAGFAPLAVGGAPPPTSTRAAEPTVGSELLARHAEHVQQLAGVHAAWLAHQTALHERFLALRTRGQGLLLDGLRSRPGPTPLARADLDPPRSPVPAPPRPSVHSSVGSPADSSVGSPADSSASPSVASPRPPSPRPLGAAPARPWRPQRDPDPGSPEPTGPSFDRAALETHASASISAIFGPGFSAQDRHELQVRMPEPPLLLSDRVVGVDATPATMGLGTLWSETDVTSDAWYLHGGRMPAGIMIESGQADLMLISYLGVDLLNRGERVYRLLGCTLTYHGDLPAVDETLRYDIHVDGHAAQGPVRLFFFHYDCRVHGDLRLTVRDGQAGFFTEGELAGSAGCLWTPQDQEIVADPRLDPPPIVPQRSALTHDQLAAFAAGRPWDCFGDGFHRARSHQRTPSIQSGPMLLLDRVEQLELRGGPWQRGYLRAETPIAPDDWFFDGHFKNDPCMPGTLMFEGCLQAMAVFLASTGVTVDRDGWRFQPVPGEPFDLRCRGQVTPDSRRLTYEIFVEEYLAGPTPTLYADLLCTVDGLKAFHARRVGLQLVADWPLATRGDLKGVRDDRAVAVPGDVTLDHDSLLACAWGRPSDAFGALWRPFDGGRRVARLPGPPYHFMSRVADVTGPPGAFEPGIRAVLEYDVPPDAWFFTEGGAATMPFCVLLEAALQPCGWLACYVGSALTSDQPLSFRNLDGEGRLLEELPVDCGTLTTEVTLTGVSPSAGMIIQSFEVQCSVRGRPIYEMKTVFGFFPDGALARQVGLPTDDVARAALAEPSDVLVDLTGRPARYFDPRRLHLAEPMLLMLDRITGWWPGGGEAGRGRVRGEKDVDPSEWFFAAHFYSDPVQPGSLGLEALLQLLQWLAIEQGLDDGVTDPHFEPVELDAPHSWKYRGQVLPENGLITSTVDVLELDRRRRVVRGRGSLWVDGKRIYEAELGVRVAGHALRAPPGDDGARFGVIGPRARRLRLDRLVSGPRHPRVEPGAGARYWARAQGVDEWPFAELCLALGTRWLDFAIEDPAALDAAAAGPVLFAANHQTAVESLLFAACAAPLWERPVGIVAKGEHRTSWLGRLIAHGFRWPGLAHDDLLLLFDRERPEALTELLAAHAGAIADGSRSLLVHVEGTRAVRAGQPVERASGALLDLALETSAAVVPVRFTGGLPVDGAHRRDLPVSRQTAWLGTPITPAELARLDYGRRTRRLLRVLNELGPRHEQPLAAEPDAIEPPGAFARAFGEGAPRGHRARALRAALRGQRADAEALDSWSQELLAWLQGDDPDRLLPATGATPAGR